MNLEKSIKALEKEKKKKLKEKAAQDTNEDVKTLQTENRILKEEILKFKAEGDEKDKELKEIMDNLQNLPHPLRSNKPDALSKVLYQPATEVIEPIKLRNFLVWSLTFALSLNSVTVDNLKSDPVNVESERSRKTALKLLKGLLEALLSEKISQPGVNNWEIFEEAIQGFDSYFNFLEGHNRFDNILAVSSVDDVEVKYENISKLLSQYERGVFDRRLEDSAWSLFYRQNRLSSELTAGIVEGGWSALDSILKFYRETSSKQSDVQKSQERNISVEMKEINTSFEKILGEYGRRKAQIEEIRVEKLKAEGKKIIKDENIEGVSEGFRIIVEENQALRGINQELKEKVAALERKNKENEAYLRGSLVTILQYITQTSNLELIALDLKERDVINKEKIDELTALAKLRNASPTKNTAQDEAKEEEICKRENLQLRQINFGLIIEKKGLERRLLTLEDKLDEKKAKCKFLKGSLKELQDQAEKGENKPDISDSYGHLLQRLMTVDTRYLMVLKTLKELVKKTDKHHPQAKVTRMMVKLVEELEEENKNLFYDKKKIENELTNLHIKAEKFKRKATNLKTKLKKQKKSIAKLSSSPKKDKSPKKDDAAEESKKLEIKSLELGIMRSSLEFVTSILVENKGGKSREIIKDCMEYVTVMEQSLADLRRDNSRLKKENIALKTGLEAQKALKKYEKVKTLNLQEDIDICLKFKEYYKLQVESAASQFGNELKSFGISPEVLEKADKENNVSDNYNQEFYNNLRKYIGNCHLMMANLKKDNLRLRGDLQKAEKKLQDTEILRKLNLKPYINELYKTSLQSQKFFKRQKQILNIYQCIIALPTLDQNTVDYFSDIQKTLLENFISFGSDNLNPNPSSPLRKPEPFDHTESTSGEEEDDSDKSSDNEESTKSHQAIANIERVEKLRSQNRFIMNKLKGKFEELDLVKTALKQGRFPGLVGQEQEFTLENFLDLSTKCDKLEIENVQLREALDRREKREKDRAAMISSLEEEYHLIKEELNLLTRKKEREEAMLKNLTGEFVGEEENLMSFLVNEVSSFKLQLKSLELKQRTTQREKIEAEAELERIQRQFKQTKRLLTEKHNENVKMELEIFYLKNDLGKFYVLSS